MEASQVMKKGFDLSFFGVGAGGVALGIIASLAGFLMDFTLVVRRIPIPGIVIGIAGLILIVAGAIVVAISFRQQKCVRCGKSMTLHLAAFPPEGEAVLQRALHSQDVNALTAVSPGNFGSPHIAVSCEYCERCRSAAVVEASFLTGTGSPKVSTVWNGATTPQLIGFMEEREAFHEQRYAESA